MQFQVPQFIDTAPKLVGPLTLRQFLYIAAAALVSFLLFFILQFILWVIIAGMLVGGATALAFARVNGQPLERTLVAAFQYFWNPRIYLWKRTEEKARLPELHAPEKKSVLNFKEIAEGLTKSLSFSAIAPSKKPLPERTPLTDLSLKMTTTVRPIEKREKSTRLFGLLGPQKDMFEEFRKTTGEREEAKRIDYR
jgi:hypothetical protein